MNSEAVGNAITTASARSEITGLFKALAIYRKGIAVRGRVGRCSRNLRTKVMA